MNDIIIAIDGTWLQVNQQYLNVAKSLNFVYVDSGSSYRAVTWFSLRLISEFWAIIINDLGTKSYFFNQNNKIV